MTPSLNELLALLAGRNVTILTGAGISTESGIPDYRGPKTRMQARNPVQFRRFMDDAAARQRYWARAVVGWPRFAAAQPNAGHRAVAELERLGRVAGVITQNVDRLHHAAGSEQVVELHGALARVRCLACGQVESREHLQARLVEANPGWPAHVARLAPDGDAELVEVDGFVVVACEDCGGVLKPDVVFFGETVPGPVVERAYALLGAGDALLVVGSSLAVFSGYRFVRKAKKRGMPIAIINLGPTRGDREADLTVDARAGDVLPQIVSVWRSAGTTRT